MNDFGITFAYCFYVKRKLEKGEGCPGEVEDITFARGGGRPCILHIATKCGVCPYFSKEALREKQLNYQRYFDALL